MNEISTPEVDQAVDAPEQLIALNQLGPICNNVRKSARTGIEELAAMIAAKGLIYPLLVTPMGERFGVVAGGRRLAALQLLAAQGSIKPDYLVKCKLVNAESATEVSIMENQHQAMHPADEFEAFQALIDQGKSIVTVADTFGLSLLHVRRRLKLARVNPALLKEYRADKLTLDQVMALTLTEDHKHQMQVYKSLSSWNASAQHIKNKILDGEVSSKDWRLKLVGREEYVKAGGGFREDLFADKDDAEFLTDTGLLDMLFAEFIERKRGALLSQGWMFAHVSEEWRFADERKYSEWPTIERKLPRAQREERRRIKERIDAIDDEHADLDEDSEEDSAKCDALDVELTSLREQLKPLDALSKFTTKPDKGYAGAVIVIEGQSLSVKTGLIRAGDLKLVTSHLQSLADADMPGDGPTEASADGGPGDDVSADGADADDGPGSGFSERLMSDLTAHRTMALQVGVMNTPRVALALLASRFAQITWGARDRAHPLKNIQGSDAIYALQKASPTIEQSDAHLAVKTREGELGEMLEGVESDWFDFLVDQPQSISESIIALAVAKNVNAVMTSEKSPDRGASLARVLELDMKAHWKPNEENFFRMLNKAQIIEAVATVKPEVAPALQSLKKPEVIRQAVEILGESGYLPKPLQAKP